MEGHTKDVVVVVKDSFGKRLFTQVNVSEDGCVLTIHLLRIRQRV